MNAMMDMEALRREHEAFEREVATAVSSSFLRVVDVEYIRDYIMRLEFSDGVAKTIDFFPLLKDPLFEPLQDMDNFIQFALTYTTLECYNGADFAPEYLHEQPDLRNGGFTDKGVESNTTK
jgi:hypothetical protein